MHCLPQGSNLFAPDMESMAQSIMSAPAAAAASCVATPVPAVS